MYTYIVCPGVVKSKSDSDLHYISAYQLMSLYKVKPDECIIVEDAESARGIDWYNHIVLRPRTDGNYSLT